MDRLDPGPRHRRGGASRGLAAPEGRRSPRYRLKTVILTTFGVLGALSVLWLITANLAGLLLIVFRTGSMAPEIPQGGVALSQWRAVEELAVGDVVTVPRPLDSVPVTHRIVGVAPTATGAELTLQGDANPTPDAQTYLVSGTVPTVLGSVPWGGQALSALQTPQGVGLLLGISAALVTWAFWPERGTGRRVRS